MGTVGPDHFAAANKLVEHAEYTSKDPGAEEIIVAIRALTLATLANAAATAATIQDSEQRKRWAKVIGR